VERPQCSGNTLDLGIHLERHFGIGRRRALIEAVAAKLRLGLRYTAETQVEVS
jgi:hypothetical protein